MRSKSKQRESRYTSAREMVDKRAAGFTAPYLEVPKGVTMFKPKAGVMLLDILPFEVGAGNPWAEEGQLHWERTFWVHKGIGANSDSFLCPRRNNKEKCPICEFRAKLEAKGEADEELLKSLMPKERQLFNVLDRKAPDKGVQLWDMSFHLFGKVIQGRLRDADEDDGWDLFFSLDEGKTLKVGFAEKTFNGRTFLEVETIDFKPREAYDEDMLEKVHSLDSLLKEVSYDELKKTFLESTEDDPAPRKGKGKPKEDEDEEEEDEEEAPKAYMRKAPADDDDEEEETDSDEEEEDEPKKSKKPAKDKDDDWDDFDEDDEEEKPKKGKKSKSDDDEEEPDDADDEEEEKPKKGAFSKRKGDKGWDADEEEEDEDEPKSKKKPKSDDDEEEDEPEPQVGDDEDDEEPAPKKKSKKDADDDWDDLEDDDEEEKSKKKGQK